MNEVYSAFYLDPICGEWVFIGSNQDQAQLLSQCKIFFSINFSFKPKEIFDSIVGFVSAAKVSYLIVCNKMQSINLLGQTIYKPDNVQFIQCKMMLITEHLGDQLIVNNNLLHLNLLFGFDQIYAKYEQAQQLQMQEQQMEQEIQVGDLIQQLQQFFQDYSQNMYFSDTLDLTNILSDYKTSQHIYRSQYYINNLLFQKMAQFQSDILFKTRQNSLDAADSFEETSQQDYNTIQITKVILGNISQVEFFIEKQRFLQTIVTRQNVLHVGTRYNARGLNSIAGAANEFEHEIIYECVPEYQNQNISSTQQRNPQNNTQCYITGFCCGYTILRGTVPVHWYSSAGLLKHEFLLKDQPFLLANFYWQQIFNEYDNCIILNLLKVPQTPKSSIAQDTCLENSDQGNDDTIIPLINLDQPMIQNTQANLTTSERIISGAYKEYVQKSQYKDKIQYYNYDWHKQLKEIKQQTKLWFKNGGQMSPNGPNIFIDYIPDSNNITVNENSKNTLKQLRKQQIYVIQMMNVILLLQQVQLNNFDMTFGVYKFQSNKHCKINIIFRQRNILRINCADSLDRTNIAIFHLQSFINSINIRFFIKQMQQINDIILKYDTEYESQILNSQTLAFSSVSRQQSYTIGESMEIYKEYKIHINQYLKKFAEQKLLDPHNQLIINLSQLENLLFSEQQGKIYQKLSLIFFDIANIISMIYTGVPAAHQEIMELFSDIDIQSNSIIALKRRIVSMKNQEKVRNETMGIISVRYLLNYYKIMPFNPDFNQRVMQYNYYGQQKGQTQLQGKGQENNYSTYSITPSQQDFIQFSYFNYIYNLENTNQHTMDVFTASQLSYQLLKELISKYNVQQIKYYMLFLTQQTQIAKSQHLVDYIYQLYQNHQKILLKNEDLYHFYNSKPGLDFYTSYEFDELQPFSILQKCNLIKYTYFMQKPQSDQDRIKESIKIQLSTDFCSLDFPTNVGLTYQYPIYLIQEKLNIYRDDIQNEIMNTLLSNQIKQYNCFPIQFSFTTLVSLSEIVVIIPQQHVGQCCKKFLVVGTDENDIEFLVTIINLPQQIPGEQQLYFRMQQFQLQSNNYNYLLLNSLSQLFTGQNIISCISNFPRLKKLELIFIYKKDECNVLPKIYLIGAQRKTLQKRCIVPIDSFQFMKFEEDAANNDKVGLDGSGKFHDIILGIHDYLIQAKIMDLENIIRPYDIKLPEQKTYLLLLFDTQSHIHQKNIRDDCLKYIYAQLFSGNISELMLIQQTFGQQIISESFLIHCYILSLEIPMYYVYGLLQLLSSTPADIQSIISGQLDINQIDLQRYRVYQYPQDNQIVINNQNIKLDYLLQNNYDIDYYSLSTEGKQESMINNGLFKIHDIIDQNTISRLYGQSGKNSYAICSKCQKENAITQCFICKMLCCVNCVFGNLHVNIIGFDLSRQIITCTQCGIVVTQIQNMISRFLYLNMFKGSNIHTLSDSFNMKVNITKNQIILNQLSDAQDAILHISNRVIIDPIPQLIQSTHNKYQTSYRLQSFETELRINYRLSTQRKLAPSEIQLTVPQKTQLTSFYVHLAAVGSYFQLTDMTKQQQQTDILQKITPHDQKVEKHNDGTELHYFYVLQYLSQIKEVKILNTKPLPYQILIFLHAKHEDDSYIKAKKRPSRHIKAKQTEECNTLEQIKLSVASTAIGDKYMSYGIHTNETVNRITIKLFYRDMINKKDNFQYPELWS